MPAVCRLHFPPRQSLPSEKPVQVTLGMGKRCLLVRGLVMLLEDVLRVAPQHGLSRESLDTWQLHFRGHTMPSRKPGQTRPPGELGMMRLAGVQGFYMVILAKFCSVLFATRSYL